MGSPEAVRTELRAIAEGPPRATVRDFAAQLGKLSLHYWRPDFTPEQAKHMYGDFVHDLDGVTAEELAEACREWRTDPLNSFFPTPGKLLELVKEGIQDRRRDQEGARYLMGLLGHTPEEKPEFDARAKLQALAEGMRASTAVKTSDPEEIQVKAPTFSTAREKTDASELKDHLARKLA